MTAKHRLDEALADWVLCRRDFVFWFSSVHGQWLNYGPNSTPPERKYCL